MNSRCNSYAMLKNIFEIYVLKNGILYAVIYEGLTFLRIYNEKNTCNFNYFYDSVML